MPITLLDIFLLVVMLISGLLAMVRGFMREVLSIAAWGLAALATLLLYPRLLPLAKSYFSNDYLAAGVVVGGVFLLTLLVVSVITVRISDKILDSRIGALDRTLGFLFGLARGLIIVVVAYAFFDWLVPVKSQPTWVTGAKSRVVLAGTADWLKSMSPDLEALYQKYKKKPAGDQDQPPDAAPGNRSERTPGPRDVRETAGYQRGERLGMRNLIETTAVR